MQYSCDLNQTNIVGNNNKFYKMQVHVAGGQYILYARYGRVGSKGQITEKTFISPGTCSSEYCKTFIKEEKGGYVALQTKSPDAVIETNIHSKATQASTQAVPEFADSTLAPEVKKLLEFITDTKAMKQTMIDQGIDLEKLPLGNLSEETIKQGFKYLCEIDAIL